MSVRFSLGVSRLRAAVVSPRPRWAGLMAFLGLAACLPPEGAGDVSGDYTVSYTGGWTVFEDDVKVGVIEAGERESVSLRGGVLTLQVLCAAADRLCPDEALWGEVEISHPLPQVLAAIEIINLDPAVGELGARLEGFSQPNGDFEAFAGLDTRCEEPAVGLVAGRFVEEGIEGGTVAWEYPAGCELDGLRLERPVRIEAAFMALRVGEGS